MPTERVQKRLTVMATVLSAIIAIISAVEMRDHVRLVEIIALFGSGAGTGAALAATLVRRKLGISEGSAS